MKIAIGIEYDGSRFHGWQSQPSGETVQDHLERALASIAGEPVRLAAAGRTDAGVHALAQVAHFETSVLRPESAWVRGVNALLAPSVAVQWAVPVADDFHARYSAVSRSYRYVLYNHPVRPALHHGRVGWFHLPLDTDAMCAALAHLSGEHDFSAFRSSECQAKSPVRTLQRAAIERHGVYLSFGSPRMASCITWYAISSAAWSMWERENILRSDWPRCWRAVIAVWLHRHFRRTGCISRP